jgi:hypothetical protein
MKKTRILLALTLTLTFLGTISIITINPFNQEPSVYCAGNVASANGSGNNGNLSLSFGAFDHGEGNITGQATFIDKAKNIKVSIDVECVTVNGNIATVGGTVQKSTIPDFAPGSGVSFMVADNGEGIDSKPDLFSHPSGVGCGKEAKYVLMPSDAGNIQVRFVAPDKDCEKCPFGTHCAGNGECVGGGSGTKCPPKYKECCGNCVSEFELCPSECEGEK